MCVCEGEEVCVSVCGIQERVCVCVWCTGVCVWYTYVWMYVCVGRGCMCEVQCVLEMEGMCVCV